MFPADHNILYKRVVCIVHISLSTRLYVEQTPFVLYFLQAFSPINFSSLTVNSAISALILA